MVKPDVKHNYYSDLELPTSASLDDIRKQYRKLALQYHPDRNAGREEECVPKFQAIQAANEVLGDPNVKQKYDTDRRKTGLYPAFTPRQPTPGNPYTAHSAYAPPPRRTQPGAWQRPQPSAGVPPTGPAPNGADRFSNFPRQPPTAKKDTPQDSFNMFRAWQNMNNPQNPPNNQTRQSTFNQPHPQPPPQPQPQPHTQSQPRPARPRPQPPPRADAKMPTEEQIRAGMKYKAPPPFEPESADKRQQAWSAFQQTNAGNPGMARSNTWRTPKKHGFNPNAPGSDERSAPPHESHYAHTGKPEGFGPQRPGVKVPPPPRAHPTHGGPTSTPISPVSPTNQRPRADPTRPFSSGHTGEVPYAEANRKRTPYTSFIGEKTDFSGEGLRRSYSVRDATKLGPEDAANRARARSSSPTRRRTPSHEDHHDSQRKPFVVYSSSESLRSDENMTQEADDVNGSTTSQAPETATYASRPKVFAVPRSRRANGAAATNGATDGAQSEGEQPGMQQKSRSNMYAHPLPDSSTTFDPGSWTTRMFGSSSTARAQRSWFKIPTWAIPSSLNPTLKRAKAETAFDSPLDPPSTGKEEYVTGADEFYVNATWAEQKAYLYFRVQTRKEFGYIPDNLDMEVFLKAASTACRGQTTGNSVIDEIMRRVFRYVSNNCNVSDEEYDSTANDGVDNSFTFPDDPELFTPTSATGHKSRSEENINTKFSAEPWTGSFTGEPDYFENSVPSGGVRQQQPSPIRRAAMNSAANQQQQPRSTTMDIPNSTPGEEIPQRPWGSDGTPNEYPRQWAPVDGIFSKEEWEQKFKDASWTWPPPPPGPPSPTKAAPASTRKQSQGRRASKPANRKTTAGAKQQQQHSVVDEDDTVQVEGADGRPENGTPIVDDGDAMDIDHTPPAQQRDQQADDKHNQNQANQKEARTYAVPPSAWRQQQDKQRNRKSSNASRRGAHRASGADQTGAKFNTNLDDLRNVEPFNQTAGDSNNAGGFNLSGMSSTLPFQSQAADSGFSRTISNEPIPIPQLPKAPEQPQRWTKSSWHSYASAFASYVQAFHNSFDKPLLEHFAARDREVQNQMASGMGWLEATGDTSGMLSGPSGFGVYARAVDADERVREAWKVGWDRHQIAVREFRRVREVVRRLVVGGGLVEG